MTNDPRAGAADAIPRTYAEFRDHWKLRGHDLRGSYAGGDHSWLVSVLPPDALELSVPETIGLLSRRFGTVIDAALSAEHTDPAGGAPDLPAELRGPLRDAQDTGWMRRANVVGINVRTLGSFFPVIRYLLTVPSFYDAVHLLPIWEPGVVGSLYGMSSWEINGEFFDPAFAEEYPHLATATAQLRAVANLIHATGRAIGMDVIPHTDRFSEIALAQPWLFEWLRREDTDIVDHRSNLHEEVQQRILDYIDVHGPAPGAQPNAGPSAGLSAEAAPRAASGEGAAARAGGGPRPGAGDPPPVPARDAFFSDAVDEATRRRILFGDSHDPEGRAARRGEIVHFVHAYGYEPVPATMAPPYRGLVVDLENRSVDSNGDVWRDYRIAEPQSMSRVFGPLARYKLYERLDDNRTWRVDFTRPRQAVWDYVCNHYAAVQERFGFDFMRGDMSHVQMRAGGVPAEIGANYDIHAAVKRTIRRGGGRDATDASRTARTATPWFAYFSETFMAPRGIMAYGDEIDHLSASDAEVTLGDLQSVPVHTDEFLQRFRRYLDVASTRYVAPSFTVMTGDKDDPRFDEFYLAGNEVRAFLSLFLVDLPSYTALGFELRDIHTEAAPNEYYTKLYVFQERAGPKATTGPYRFGRNGHLFHNLTRLRLVAEELLPDLSGGSVEWLRAPDPTGGDRFLAWRVKPNGESTDAPFLFVANTDTAHAVSNFNVPWPGAAGAALVFTSRSTGRSDTPSASEASGAFATAGTSQSGAVTTRRGVKIWSLEPGECRIYRIADG